MATVFAARRHPAPAMMAPRGPGHAGATAKVRFTIGRMMIGVAVVGTVLGLAYERLVMQPAKDALRDRIQAHERGAAYWDDLGRSDVKAALTAASKVAVRALRDWHRGRARELGRLDPM